MGFSFGSHKRDVDKEKHLRRLHQTTKFIESPLVGADPNNLVFSQRHEANSVELFFDLFFVANLATFTAYHSITDLDYLLGYVGFFGILWATWFQITLHDVRFARDTLYERICKTIQFIVFVGLALVGSQFNPASKTGNSMNFRIMCYVLVLSRGLLAIQYTVVLFFTWKARYSKIFLPIGLMIGIYALATAAFAAMTPSFKASGPANHRLIYLVWYAVMILEGVIVITISCVWRMLSFKKTHLMERMSLLTIIVIGEGAIGVTKTVSRIMGKHGLDVEGCFLIMSIIVILVFLWALYFDNFPHGHYGTIRQQVWSILHFPLQLGIVGVVEGAQQLAIARYVSKNVEKITGKLSDYCLDQNLDGKKLRDKILDLITYYQLDKKAETWQYYQYALNNTYIIGNTTGICSKANITKNADDDVWPDAVANVASNISNGLYVALGMKLPVNKLLVYTPLQIAVKGWKIVYMYFWASFITVILSLIIFLLLIRRHKADLFDFTSVIIRFLVVVTSVGMMALIGNKERLYDAIGSPALLPIIVVLMFIILVVDKTSSVFCNWRLKKSGQPYALEVHEEHHEAGHGEHGEPHEVQHLDASYDHHNKEAHYNERAVAAPFQDVPTAYQSSPPNEYPMSPPLMSPNPSNPTAGHTSGGYMPVAGGPPRTV